MSKHETLTFTSISPTFAVDLIMGLPTIEGKMWAGKFEPAYPHLTNCNLKILNQISSLLNITSSCVTTYQSYPCSIVANENFISLGIHDRAVHRPLSSKPIWPLLTSSTPPCHVIARFLAPPPRLPSCTCLVGCFWLAFSSITNLSNLAQMRKRLCRSKYFSLSS